MIDADAPAPADDWNDEERPPTDLDVLLLNIDGFEGPIDLLLALARDQKVDLRQISILQLAEQYLVFVAEARRHDLELAADYLVMAAWLAYLKSRLLLPATKNEEEPSGAEMAAALAFQLERLDAMRRAGEALVARPRLGLDVFARGAPEGVRDIAKPIYEARIYDLLAAYGAFTARNTETRLEIHEAKLFSVDEALSRLSYLIGATTSWQTLEAFLPPGLSDPLYRRSAVGATLVAALELTRQGKLRLRQDGGPFSPIRLRKADE